MPPICVDFDPNVPVPLGTSSVSPLTTVTFSIGSPSRSAAIIANVVSWPWPCENEPVCTIAPPSDVISTSPYSASPSGFVISVYELMPIPSSIAPPSLAAPALLGAQLLVAGGAQREVERSFVVTGVVRRAGSGLVRERVLRDEVLAPHLHGIHADLGGEQVDHALDRLGGLGPPGAAERRHRSRVRHHGAALDLDARNGVDTARQEARQVRQEGADPRVRTRVLGDVDAVCEHRAVPRAAERELEDWPRPWGSATMLSLRDSVQRTGVPRWRASQTTSASSAPNALLAPKPPPTSGAMMRSSRRLDPERPGDPELVPVRHLRGEPRGDPAVRVRLGGGRAHFERARSHPLADERLRDDDVAARRTAPRRARASRRGPRCSSRSPGRAAPRPSRPPAGRRRPAAGRTRRRRAPLRRRRRRDPRSGRSRRCLRRSERRPWRRAGASSAARGPGWAAGRSGRRRRRRRSAPARSGAPRRRSCRPR